MHVKNYIPKKQSVNHFYKEHRVIDAYNPLFFGHKT